ncbi:MAG: M67 family metallopeptidase [Gemmataceae bacterium]
MSPLLIPRSVFDQMTAHARAALPAEGCGFLAGIAGEVTHFLPLVNELASPTAFATEAKSVFAAYKTMRAAGTDVLAIYHSHPTSAPVPSRHDLAQNTYGPGVAWVIVGLAGDDPEVRVWWLSDDGYSEAEWAVV